MLLALSGAIVLHSSVDCLCTESTKMDSTSPTIYVVVVPLLQIIHETFGSIWISSIRNQVSKTRSRYPQAYNYKTIT